MKKVILFSSLGLILLWLGGYGVFAGKVSALSASNTPKTTDAIIVLTGGNGRIEHGVALYRAHKAKHLFISGVNPQVDVREMSKTWADEGSLPECCITLGHEAVNTRGNATESGLWMKKNNLSSARLVTSSYHMPRAMLEFRHTLPDAILVPYPVVPENYSSWRGGFWTITMGEYNKTILTWLRLKLTLQKP